MLDATHLHMIVNEFFKENPDAKTFLPVHDEFGVHPNDVELLQNCVEKTFRELHESEPLKQFWRSAGLDDDDYPIRGESFLGELDGKSMVSF
jgi:DNA-directed RNA polymerase